MLLFEAGNPDQLGPALDSIAAANVAAVNVLASPFLQVSRQEIIRRMHDYRLPAIRMAVDDIDVSNLLGKVSAPSIVFHCTRDNLVPFNQGQQLAAGILNSKFVGLTSANHAMLSDEPAWAVFIKELDTFLESST